MPLIFFCIQLQNEDVIEQVTLPNVLYNVSNYIYKERHPNVSVSHATFVDAVVEPTNSSGKYHPSAIVTSEGSQSESQYEDCSESAADSNNDTKNCGDKELVDDYIACDENLDSDALESDELQNNEKLSALVKNNEENTENKHITNLSISIDVDSLLQLQQRVQLYAGDWATLPQVIKQNCSNRNSIHDELIQDSYVSPFTDDNARSTKIITTCEKQAVKSASNNGENLEIKAITALEIGECDDYKFDVILTSETVYNEDNYDKLIDTIMACLKPTGFV